MTNDVSSYFPAAVVKVNGYNWNTRGKEFDNEN